MARKRRNLFGAIFAFALAGAITGTLLWHQQRVAYATQPPVCSPSTPYGTLSSGIDSSCNQHPLQVDSGGALLVVSSSSSTSNVQGTQADGSATEPNPVLVSGWNAVPNAIMESITVGQEAAQIGSASVTPNILEVGGMDGPQGGTQHAYGLTVAPATATVSATSPILVVGGVNASTNPSFLPVSGIGALPEGNSVTVGGTTTGDAAGIEATFNQSSTAYSNGLVKGVTAVVDPLDMAPALGAPTNTALTATTSVAVQGGTMAAGACWMLVCNVDVNYRITNGASTALSTDILLPAKTTLQKCNGTATQTNITVYPSANGQCEWSALQVAP